MKNEEKTHHEKCAQDVMETWSTKLHWQIKSTLARKKEVKHVHGKLEAFFIKN